MTVGAAGPTTLDDDVPAVWREAVRTVSGAGVARVSPAPGPAPATSGSRVWSSGRHPTSTATCGQHLGPLLDYDTRRGSELVKTLQAYFDAGGSPRHAATDLHVHVNTVSQRLERISALLGPHWQRPDDALELQLALRLMRLQVNRLSAGGSPTR